jgi:hypothetical protein
MKLQCIGPLGSEAVHIIQAYRHQTFLEQPDPQLVCFIHILLAYEQFNTVDSSIPMAEDAQ